MTSAPAPALRMESSRRHSLARSLFICIFLSVALLTTALGIASVVLARQRLMQNIEREARLLSMRLATHVALDLWNLDVPALEQYLTLLPLHGEVAYVCIRNEFMDPVALTGVVRAGKIVASEPVYHSGELIGYAEIGMSMREVVALQKTVTRYGVGVTLISSLVLALVVWAATGVLIRRPLRQLTQGLKRIADGDYEAPLPSSPYVEIDEINGEVNTMAQTIALRTRQLEAEVAERRRAEADLRALAGKLEYIVEDRTRALTQTNRRLSEQIARRMQAQGEILAISSHEQRRIGHDLHDSLGQELAGAAFLGGAMTRALRDVSPELAAQADQLTRILSRSVSEIRQIAHGLTPVEPTASGLVDALKAVCSESSRTFGVDCSFRSGESSGTPDPAATHLYRIVQEAIHNAVRHGHAAHVVVSLQEDRETGLGTLSVEDDGTGLPDPSADPSGLGIRTMRYRAEAINGRLDLSAMPRGGTRVLVEFKLGATAVPGESAPAGQAS